MRDFVSEPKHMIFTEDLKNMVHMAEPTDLDLILNMIKKFNNQNVEFRFGSFIFGPVVMRMFHFLDAPNEALKSFEDPENSGFYDQLVSYHILLDLLYSHEMFDDMYRVFEKVQEKQLNMTKFPKYPLILVLAACYKQNTPKSLEYATKIWTEMTSVGTVPVRRAATLFAALALNQGAPHIALESISMQKPHYVTIRNIKAIALAEMGRVDDALPVLKAVMDIDLPEQNQKHTFFDETISKVRSCVEKTENKDLQKEFENIEKALRDRDLIDNQTLDSLVTSEINLTNRNTRKLQGMPQMPYGMRKNRQNTRENMV
ncbi:Pentatricopeptide repeat-containing protein 2 [Papilio xuthus]|uniref:Pentatricopeptide repeat-containing protein 2 n=1 Tax=Papilio xuthus TaxID=66420 RepID=A0A194QLB7_PAPXU|nr:Pentatricopeptide repeat-containing protein 2 [Papilio xuthus]